MNWNWVRTFVLNGEVKEELSRIETGVEDLQVKLLEERFHEHTFKISRRHSNGMGLKTTEDMYVEALAQLTSKWTLTSNGELSEFNQDPDYVEAIMRIELTKPPNQRGGFSLFPCIRVPGERDLPVPPQEIVQAYREWDVFYWRRYFSLSYTALQWHSIFKEIRHNDQVLYKGLAWEENCYHPLSYPLHTRIEPVVGSEATQVERIPTLVILCMRKLSWTNRAFTGDKDGPYSVHSMANLYPKKLPRMLEKFNKSTKLNGPKIKATEQWWSGALDMLYYAIGTRPMFQSQVWDFEEARDEAVANVRKNTSAGLRAGPRNEEKVAGVRVVAGVTGKKMEQLPYAIKQLNILKEEILRNPNVTPQDAGSQTTLKDETFNSDGLPEADRKDLCWKLRPYYILSLFQYLMAAMAGGFRQHVERGRVIKIGLSFWYGGATALGMGLGFDDPEMIFEDGDFKHLDTSIHMTLLMLYVTQSFVYFNWDKMTSPNRIILKAFFRICAERLSIKVTHLFSTIWRVIYGGMPSGAYETSHGDSWIIAFLYFLYIRQVMAKHPERCAQIKELFRLFRCGIIVYGDDHVLFTHRDVHDIINEMGFARFVHEFWGMQIRDIHRARFITIPDPLTGQIIYPGIVFLKRYFIRRETVFSADEITQYMMSPVLPYRPLHAIVMKYAYGKGEEKSIVEYIVSAIGMAYDTQGTNKVAYDFCLHMYNRLSVKVYGNITEILEQFMVDLVRDGKDTYITRLMRTAAISQDDIVRGFPSWEDLMARHKYSKDYVKFGGFRTKIEEFRF
jgi:hypothetical protein